MDYGAPRTVVVTGGSRGLGLGIAKSLAAHGYRVVVVARRENDSLGAAIRGVASPGSMHFAPFDLECLSELHNFVREVRKTHGPIYGLVNNAGIGTEGVLATMHVSAIERLVRLNTVAPMILTKHVVSSMMAKSAGRIINMSSIIATTGYNALSVYAATKASMIGFTRSLAREVGSLGITVNAIAPGFVDTEMTSMLDDTQRAKIARRSALGRLTSIEDVAGAATFLMSDEAAGITGTIMTVDAGNTA